MIFRELEVWFDPLARDGPEAMAVDEVLLITCELPLLRIYGWDGAWGSLGYFGKLEEADQGLSDLNWVRRWTGGGVVDHRGDWTYSLIVPKAWPVATMKKGESYCAIHRVLVDVLKAEGVTPGLSCGDKKAGSLCFENPVEFDVMDGKGTKLAGAAQRRSKDGLLHQGSVAKASPGRLRGELFTERLAESWAEVSVFPDEDKVAGLVSAKYGAKEWLERC